MLYNLYTGTPFRCSCCATSMQRAQRHPRYAHAAYTHAHRKSSSATGQSGCLALTARLLGSPQERCSPGAPYLTLATTPCQGHSSKRRFVLRHVTVKTYHATALPLSMPETALKGLLLQASRWWPLDSRGTRSYHSTESMAGTRCTAQQTHLGRTRHLVGASSESCIDTVLVLLCLVLEGEL